MGRYTDYDMPSGEIIYPSLTRIEKQSLNRSPVEEDWTEVWFALGLLVLLIVLTWAYFQVPTVHAASNDLYEVHQNDYYCSHLGNYINGGNHKLIDFCAKYLTK